MSSVKFYQDALNVKLDNLRIAQEIVDNCKTEREVWDVEQDVFFWQDEVKAFKEMHFFNLRQELSKEVFNSKYEVLTEYSNYYASREHIESLDEHFVWTLVYNDVNQLVLVNGLHHTDRVSTFVSQNKWTSDIMVKW